MKSTLRPPRRRGRALARRRAGESPLAGADRRGLRSTQLDVAGRRTSSWTPVIGRRPVRPRQGIDDEERVWLDLHGRAPDPSVLDWAESRARELGGSPGYSRAGGRPSGRSSTSSGAAATDSSASSWRMEIDLDGAIPSTYLAGTRVEVRTIRPGEERTVWEVQQETFRDVWEPIEESFDEWSHFLLQPPRFVPELWFVAVDGDEIAGFAICHPLPDAPRPRLGRRARRKAGLADARARAGAPPARFPRVQGAGAGAGRSRRGLREPDRSAHAVRAGGHASDAPLRDLREGAAVSSLRARCPVCRTFTAVAVGDGYECHRCGGEFAAGLLRVPRAWGSGGDEMAAGASLPLPYPEVGVIERDSLEEQTNAIAAALPARPVVLGGCCCTHVGAATGLARRFDRLGLVWIDAHGDLNTPETSPSGNLWGMPFRMILDSGAIAAEDAALVGARSLDPPEVEFMHAVGSTTRSTERSRMSLPRTWHSTWTSSIRARWTFSSPSPTDLRSTRSKRYCATLPAARPSPESASPGSSRPIGTLPLRRASS